MAHPLKHAQSSARKFGGKAEEHLPIHNWFDESKAFLADFPDQPSPARHGFTLLQIEDRRLGVFCAQGREPHVLSPP